MKNLTFRPHFHLFLSAAVLLIMGLSIFPCLARGANPRVELKTNLGVIQLELYPDKAPITVENFLSYVNSGFYNGTIFHRVIPNFMVQGGGFTPGMNEKSTKSPIKNEAGNRLANSKGTIAMARTSEINSATSEFFINVANNDYLNHRNNSPESFGYCVFGRVIKGMDVVGKIAATQTHSVPPYENVPVKDVVIISAQQIK